MIVVRSCPGLLSFVGTACFNVNAEIAPNVAVDADFDFHDDATVDAAAVCDLTVESA